MANLISSFTEPAVSLASHCRTRQAEIVINARVAVDPETLTNLVRAALAQEAEKIGATVKINTLQSLRPGRPVPTHRILTA